MGSSTVALYQGTRVTYTLDAILVTFNYRLGIFGFPGVPLSSNGSSNLGIQDQRLAIQWVVENIAYFGGDPEQMTLMGQSVGALSAITHLSHPTTKNLFKNGILMSIPSVAYRSLESAKESHDALSKHVGCSFDDLECLYSKSMRQILTGYELAKSDPFPAGSTSIVREFPLVLDSDVPKHPLDILFEVNNGIPATLMIGTVMNETRALLQTYIPGNLSRPILDLISDFLLADESDPILARYDGAPILDEFSDDQKSVLSWMLDDRMFVCPSLKAAHVSSNPIYEYVWNVPWTGGSQDAAGPFCPHNSVCHTTDLVYLFQESANGELQKIQDAFSTHLAEFIRSGSPWSHSQVAYFQTQGTLFESHHHESDTCAIMDTMLYPHQASRAKIPSVNPEWALFLSPTLMAFFWILISLLLLAQFISLGIMWWIKRKFIRLMDSATSQVNPFVTPLTPRKRPFWSRGLSILSSLKPDVETGSISKDSLFHDDPVPVTVSIDKLTYSVKAGRKSKTLVENVSFDACPGELTALMGPSGAGKTTLMKLLAQIHPEHQRPREAQECISIGGQVLSRMRTSEFRKRVGFVPQHDPPFFGWTPREVLMFHALLQLPKRTGIRQAAKRVSYLLKALSLESCADVVIQRASEKAGISGGQFKRVAIAVVLLQQPSVLLLDEPTSGLDAASSLEVIQLLASLAKRGYTILLSIHQPRFDVFEQFTNVALMAHGHLLFHGSPDQCLGLTKRLQTSSIVPNPADAILDMAQALSVSDIPDFHKRTRAWKRTKAYRDIQVDSNELDLGMYVLPPISHTQTIRIFPESPLEEFKKSDSPTLIRFEKSLPQKPLEKTDSKPRSSWLNAFQWKKPKSQQRGIFWKMMIINTRWWTQRPFSIKCTMLMVGMVATLILAFLMRRPGSDLLSLMMQVKGVAILCVGLTALKNISVSFDVYEDLDGYNFDKQNGSVGPISFFLHRVLYETVTAIVEALSAGIVGYLILDCSLDPIRFQSFLLLFVVYYNVFLTVYIFLYSTRLGRPEARSFAFLTQAVFAICSGLWVKAGDTGFYTFMSWIQSINPSFWAMSALMRIILYNRGSCVLTDEHGTCFAWTGDALLKDLRTEESSIQDCIVGLVVLWICLRLLQLFLLIRNAYDLTRCLKNPFKR